MSHELRSPLNSLLILSKNLAEKQEGNLRENQIEYAKVINKSGNDLLQLINDILDLSKIEADKMDCYVRERRLMELAEDIQYTYKHLAETKGIEFNIHVSDSLPAAIKTDQQKLEQIIRNFISNAIKFTEKGRVTVDFHQPRKEDFTDFTLDPKTFVAISVIDTGIGIPAEKQTAIFEPFRQADGSTSRKYGGTGLGLSISKKLADLLEGKIYLKSIEKKGTTFTLYIPVKLSDHKQTKEDQRSRLRFSSFHTRENSAVSNVPEKPDKNLIGKSILLVEDDMRSLFAITAILEEKKIRVNKATNGNKALEFLAKKPDVDLVLMDIMMPEMDGYETMKRIRAHEKYKNLPIIALTAKAMEGNHEKCISAGADEYISKPIDIQNLLIMMGRLLMIFD